MSFFLKLILRTFSCKTSQQDKTAWKLTGSEICSSQNSSTIMAPKWLTYAYGMSTNKPRHGPESKPANYVIEPRNN